MTYQTVEGYPIERDATYYARDGGEIIVLGFSEGIIGTYRGSPTRWQENGFFRDSMGKTSMDIMRPITAASLKKKKPIRKRTPAKKKVPAALKSKPEATVNISPLLATKTPMKDPVVEAGNFIKSGRLNPALFVMGKTMHKVWDELFQAFKCLYRMKNYELFAEWELKISRIVDKEIAKYYMPKEMLNITDKEGWYHHDGREKPSIIPAGEYVDLKDIYGNTIFAIEENYCNWKDNPEDNIHDITHWRFNKYETKNPAPEENRTNTCRCPGVSAVRTPVDLAGIQHTTVLTVEQLALKNKPPVPSMIIYDLRLLWSGWYEYSSGAILKSVFSHKTKDEVHKEDHTSGEKLIAITKSNALRCYVGQGL